MFLNKVFVLGNLTFDPDVRSLPSGQLVANLRIATNRVYYDKNREKKEEAEFHSVVAFGRTAEIAQQYLRKGSMVLIEGRLRTRSWTDSAGNKRYRTEIIAQRMQLGPRSGKTTPPLSQNQKESEQKEEPRKEEIPIIEEEEEINVEDIPF
jgi:single-strand DNA-binding protein